MPISHITPEIAVAIGAAACLVVAMFAPRRRQFVAALLAAATSMVAAGLAWHVHTGVGARLTFSGTWAIDDLTTWATWTICAATALVAALSPNWFATDRRHGEWYVLLLLSALGAILLAGAADLLEVMVGMLLASTTGYTLASYHRQSPASAEAGAKYFFIGALTNSLLFLGIVLLFGLAGTTRYEGVKAALTGGGDPVVAVAGAALVAIGILFEVGAVPAHPWVPDVSEASPAPAAAFLTTVPKVGALVALARFVGLVGDDLVPWRLLIAAIAVATMTLGNLAAVWQQDVRRLLGWSTVSQAGYGLMAVVAVGASPLAKPALIVFVVGYTFANLAAFGVVVSLRGRTSFDHYDGLASTRFWHAAGLVVALLSLAGIPPLVGFVAKLLLFGAVINAGFAWLAVAAVVNTVISLFYYLRIIGRMVLSSPTDEPARLGGASAWVALAAALAVLALGVLANLFWAWTGLPPT